MNLNNPLNKIHPSFNGVFSRHNLPRVKDRMYVINLHDKQGKGARWVLLFIDPDTDVYFDPCEIECVSQEILSKIKDKSITHNIFRKQFDDSAVTMCSQTPNPLPYAE